MSRDHRKLKVFHEADSLVLEIYRITSALPTEERYGLQSQIRRAAVSSASNIVEGSARPSTADYCRFLHIARSSAREAGYLFSIARRLDFLPSDEAKNIERRYDALQGMLQRLTDSLDTTGSKGQA